MKIATVITEGLHLRERPRKDGRSLDQLTKGDELEVTHDVGEYLFGCVRRIANGVDADIREGVPGYFWRGGVAIKNIPETSPPAPPIPPDVPEIPVFAPWVDLPTVFGVGAALLFTALVAWVLLMMG